MAPKVGASAYEGAKPRLPILWGIKPKMTTQHFECIDGQLHIEDEVTPGVYWPFYPSTDFEMECDKPS